MGDDEDVANDNEKIAASGNLSLIIKNKLKLCLEYDNGVDRLVDECIINLGDDGYWENLMKMVEMIRKGFAYDPCEINILGMMRIKIVVLVRKCLWCG